MLARERLEEMARRHDWSAEDCLDLICGYADAQEDFWAHIPRSGTRPVDFATFLTQVEASFLEAVEQGSPEGVEEEREEPDPALAEVEKTEQIVISTTLSPSDPVDLEPPAPPAVKPETVATLTLNKKQTQIVERYLSDEYVADAVSDKALGSSQLKLTKTFQSEELAQDLTIEVDLCLGKPECYIRAQLLEGEKRVQLLQPRFKTLEGRYSFTHAGAQWTLEILPLSEAKPKTKPRGGRG